METSILTSTKKVLNIAPDDENFDLDVITHINAAFSTLNQLGLGPAVGFTIEDDSKEWSDFIEDERQQNLAKTYVYLKVRSFFDPPQTAYLVEAVEKQIQEMEFRLNVRREETEWVDPRPSDEDDDE